MSQRKNEFVNIPTPEQINPFGDLDGNHAEKNFLGKSIEEAEALFKESSLYYQEDLFWMGPKAFCFYLPAVYRYLQSKDSEEDCDILNCLAGTLDSRLKDDGSQIADAFPAMLDLCSYVLENYEKFGVDRTIYGDLKIKYEGIKNKIISFGL